MLAKQPTLYKRSTQGKILEWYAEIDGDKYRTTSGQQGGKHTTTEWTVTEAKNVGRSNEVSPEDQAISEVQSMYTKQVDKGYRYDIKDVDVVKEFKPMLATKWQDRKDKIDTQHVVMQPKLDGIRCIVRADGMWTRTGKPIVSCPHIFEALKHVFLTDPDFVFDGELYNHEYKHDFNTITSLVKKMKPTEADLENTAQKVEYWIYDTPKPAAVTERILVLEAIMHGVKSDKIVMTPTVIAGIADVDEEAARYIADGYEGAMVRLPNSEYENKRSRNLIKWKEMQDEEFEIVDIEEGVGNRAGVAAAGVFRLPDGREFRAGCIGNFDYCRALLDGKESVIGKKGTVVFQNYTPDGVPRFPKMKTVRDYE